MQKNNKLPKLVALALLFCTGWQLPAATAAGYVLDDFCRENDLELQTLVVSAQIQLRHAKARQLLPRLLNCDIQPGNNRLPLETGEFKLVVDKTNPKRLALEIITDDVQTAVRWQEWWQNFADLWGHGEVVGITLAAKAYEEMNQAACTQLCRALGQRLGLKAEIYAQPGAFDCVYSGSCGWRTVNIGGQAVGLNMAVRTIQGKSYVYLAAPIIYQTY